MMVTSTPRGVQTGGNRNKKKHTQHVEKKTGINLLCYKWNQKCLANELFFLRFVY